MTTLKALQLGCGREVLSTFSWPWPIARNLNLLSPKPDLSASFMRSVAGSEPGLKMKTMGEEAGSEGSELGEGLLARAPDAHEQCMATFNADDAVHTGQMFQSIIKHNVAPNEQYSASRKYDSRTALLLSFSSRASSVKHS
ncbi:hypothetical protein EYF80_036879 [Liparis tanakae]|uniref:Uncharacterized protein n=1 Tax=Liparis tanakae TaxID=230148 RepID=A0A4Z2GIB8_9TELE|nr:hypothetical protein EYF80_036879 [Liparis tanakae]